jgi:hypothetical protein
VSTQLPLPGDFQLAPTGGYGGELIRIGQWLNGDGFANYEHIRLYVGSGLFVEAEPDGARLARYPLTVGAWSSGLLPLTEDERANICTAAYGYIGTPYGFLDYVALATHRLHIPAPGLKPYIASTKTMICSQLVAQCYLDAGVNLFPGEWPGYVTPGDFDQLLVSKGLK